MGIVLQCLTGLGGASPETAGDVFSPGPGGFSRGHPRAVRAWSFLNFQGPLQKKNAELQIQREAWKWIQLTLEQHGFELRRSTYTWIFFFQ